MDTLAREANLLKNVLLFLPKAACSERKEFAPLDQSPSFLE